MRLGYLELRGKIGEKRGLTPRCTDSGAQPLTNADETIILAVNGEIYNHRKLRKHLKNPYHFKTHSDCEVIIPLVSTAHSSRHEWL